MYGQYAYVSNVYIIIWEECSVVCTASVWTPLRCSVPQLFRFNGGAFYDRCFISTNHPPLRRDRIRDIGETTE